MVMLLRSLRTQLSSLQCLSLDLSQGWTGAGLAWAELAAMTQLTSLCITSTYTVCAELYTACSCRLAAELATRVIIYERASACFVF
jgi:hypothetical protein